MCPLCKEIHYLCFRQMKAESNEDKPNLPFTQNTGEVVEYLDAPYYSRADKILNMSPITDEELDMYEDLYKSNLMYDTSEYDWCMNLGDNHCMFQWHWCPLPNPPTPVKKRKSKFSGVFGPTKKFTLYKAFTSIWDKTVIEHIVCETNKNANYNDTNWIDTTIDELYVFLAISLATSMYDMEDLKQYWRTESDLDNSIVTKAMSYDRFVALNYFIGFKNANEDANDFNESRATVSMIETIVIKLNKKFHTLYRMGQDVVFDEPSEFSKRKDGTYKLLKKPQNISEVNICDAKSGYVWSILISTAVKDSNLPPRGISPCIILKFMEANKNRGHTIWCDNIFNSVLLARVAYVLKCNFVGTLNEEIGSNFDKVKKKLKPGEVSGRYDNDVDFILWQDKNIVSLVTTYHGATTIEEMGRKAPAAFVDFKNNVACLDKRDEILADYIQVEGKGWVRRMFDRLLNISVYNSLIICKCAKISFDSFKKFRLNLIVELISKHGVYLKPIKEEFSYRD
ncbi:piggyBac transposable element-derived protein 4-like isoform X2 [Plodia interpunctella]|uniref:piggyBac transposable element-derived protein 4-like isoform X2 n=1 Tax=Plodia interpunctella TaxID=58824 RepID=UPI0023675E3A|nr:piggyBac transposable element-derived protein 4-like isoform X2 [Plodia interpunctella]